MSMLGTNTVSKAPQPDELIGRVINDRFRIISVIARGGMGRVYRAEQVPLGRMVAIKTLDLRHTGGEHDPQFQQRFFLEASVASKLQHPNTVTVFDYGRTVDDLYFIAMELVEGRSLLNLVRSEAPLAPSRVMHIAMQIARSLREAHRLEVIHRDLKPGNVLLAKHGDEEDFVKVLDFGLVKHVETEADMELTKAGLFMGSPKYMSPEQIRGEQTVDPRADIYALGVVMYEMLTGKVPFDRENTVKVLMAHLHEAPPPLAAANCPERLVDLVMRCLAKEPSQRPASMDEVIVLLKQADGMASTPSGAFMVSQEMRLPPASIIPPAPRESQYPVTQIGDARQLTTESGVITHAGQLAMARSDQVAPRGPGLLPKLSVIGALAIAGGFLALRFAERGDGSSAQSLPAQAPIQAPREAEPTAPRATAAVPTPGASAPEQGAAHVTVKLTSVPSGATVTADGKVYGQTPADIEWWGKPATQGRQITFEFDKAGYEKVTVVRTLHGETLDVEAKLPREHHHNRRSESGRAKSQAPRSEGAAQGPVMVPQDFKEDPY
jgi:hypothetical protein